MGGLTKVLVGSFVVLVGLILAALVVRSVMYSQSTQPHIVIPARETSEEEEIMITPCGSEFLNLLSLALVIACGSHAGWIPDSMKSL